MIGEGSAFLPDRPLFLLAICPRSKVSPPQNRAQTSSSRCRPQRPIFCLGLAAFFRHGARHPLRAPASQVALSLFYAGPISQKMYAVLPCGGIGVSRVPANRVGGWLSQLLPRLSCPPWLLGPLSRCPPPFLPSPCRGHAEACSPAPAGGQ